MCFSLIRVLGSSLSQWYSTLCRFVCAKMSLKNLRFRRHPQIPTNANIIAILRSYNMFINYFSLAISQLISFVQLLCRTSQTVCLSRLPTFHWTVKDPALHRRPTDESMAGRTNNFHSPSYYCSRFLLSWPYSPLSVNYSGLWVLYLTHQSCLKPSV